MGDSIRVSLRKVCWRLRRLIVRWCHLCHPKRELGNKIWVTGVHTVAKDKGGIKGTAGGTEPVEKGLRGLKLISHYQTELCISGSLKC